MYVEIPITNAVDLKDANNQAQKIIDAVEANVKKELSKQFDIAKEEEKAKKKLEEEIQAKQKPFTYNNKTYPRENGLPIIPV